MSDTPPPTRSARASLAPEVRLALIEERLETGNRAFYDQRIKVTDVERKLEATVADVERRFEARISGIEDQLEPAKPPPRQVWPYVMGIVSMVTIGGGWLWQVARYPDRVEFERSVASDASKFDQLEERNRDLALQLARLETQLEERASIEGVLRKVLTGGAGKKKDRE